MSEVRDTLMWLLQLQGFALEVPFGGLSGRRRWRWDAAHEERMVAVEYQGKGAHTSYVQGTWRDMEKTTEGQLCGWTVILCNVASTRDGRCMAWIERALGEGGDE